MILALTGHTNIEKCFNFILENEGVKYNQTAYDLTYNSIEESVLNIRNQYCINHDDFILVSGMARGADEVFAEVAFRNNFKLYLSIPASVEWHKFRSHSNNRRVQAINYDKYLNYASKVFEIPKNYKSEYFPNMQYRYANFARNQHMVDISNKVISFKQYNSTGTDDCIKRAKEANKYLGNININNC